MNHFRRRAGHGVNCIRSGFGAALFLFTLQTILGSLVVYSGHSLSAEGPKPEGSISQKVYSKKEEDPTKRYHWLFKDRKIDEAEKIESHTGLFDTLDRELREARRLYLSGDTENAILKYRSVIDGFEAILDDMPQGSPLLMELEQRIRIFDELALKILGPVHAEIPEDSSSEIFHVMEKRRLARRIMLLKKLPRLEFFDVPVRLIDEEDSLLRQLQDLRRDIRSQETKKKEESVKFRLTEVRQAIQRSSERYTQFRAGLPVSLLELKKEILGQKEALLDINMLPDRILVGVITKEHARYYQFAATRTEIDRVVFLLQDRLREFSHGDKTTFMGHAWKEPCRRLYRSLIGPLPPLPQDKTTIFVVPDRSLWYLPFSALLDPEDRPLGQDRIISIIPSGDILRLLRTGSTNKEAKSKSEAYLLLFESIPWIPEEQIQDRASVQSNDKRRHIGITEEERLERLILTNPVYPKPSSIVMNVQKLFHKFEVWVGPTATLDQFLSRGHGREDVTILALPFSVWDQVSQERQPVCFFSPNERGQRIVPIQQMFSHSTSSRLVVFPVAWFNVLERDNPTGEGPLLLNLALFYSGIKLVFCNYSDPNWGGDEPFLLEFLKKVAGHASVADTLAQLPREMPTGLDSSFAGRPPSWTGWILSGDVRTP